jgi:NAD(P)H-dependent flavin oxidoreductase YrpB (nitropropane dioxygenase family)
VYAEGDLDCGFVPCGQAVGQADDIPTVKEVFDRIISEAAETLGRLVES